MSLVRFVLFYVFVFRSNFFHIILIMNKKMFAGKHNIINSAGRNTIQGIARSKHAQ